MIVKVTPQWREPEILAPPWEIVHTVELPPGEFRKFKEDLLQPQPFIMEHASEMYMDEHGLAYDKTGNDHMHSEEEWDVAIASLEARLEELGTDTQQQMVYIQDYMGQYNSYLQGANTQISNSNQTLTSLARGQ